LFLLVFYSVFVFVLYYVLPEWRNKQLYVNSGRQRVKPSSIYLAHVLRYGDNTDNADDIRWVPLRSCHFYS